LLFSVMFLTLEDGIAAPGVARISQADEPLRLIRGMVLYKGGVGVLAEKSDIIETGSTGAQLEVASQLLMALGPDTRIYIESIGADAHSRTELVLLTGWLKISSVGKNTTNSVIVTSPFIRVTVADGSSIVYSALDEGEMFAEEGVQTVNEIGQGGKPGIDVKVGREQFALNGDHGLKVLPRLTKDFLDGMPQNFRQSINPIPDRLQGKMLLASKEREVDFSDVDVWLSSKFAAKEGFVNRFSARLQDGNFRRQLDAKLGHLAEWKTKLHPQATN